MDATIWIVAIDVFHAHVLSVACSSIEPLHRCRARDQIRFPTMRRTLLVISSVGAVAIGCSRPGALRTGDISSVELPVVATSMSTVYGIQLDLRGSAAVRDGWAYVKIPVGAARTYQGRANAWDLVVRAGIATCSGRGGARLIAEGRAARVAPLVGLTPDNAELDTVTRKFAAPLTLDVGIPPGTDLQRSWMTIEVSWPIESVIASYSLAATGGLVAGAPEGVSDFSARARGDRPSTGANPLDAVGARTPPIRVRCSGQR